MHQGRTTLRLGGCNGPLSARLHTRSHEILESIVGVMRFLIFDDALPGDWPEARQSYIRGFDSRIFPTQVEWNGSELSCRRPSSESGRLFVSWPVRGFGLTVVSTSSLMERDQPYLLALELARGKIGQLRNQLAEWESKGMTIPDEATKTNRQAHRMFVQAASLQEDPQESCRLANEAIVQAHEAADELTRAYAQQRLTIRSERSPHCPTSLGCGLGQGLLPSRWSELPEGVFNSVGIPIGWRQIEPHEGENDWEGCDAQVDWCLERGLLPRGGPLLDFSANGLPDWLQAWAGDLENLKTFVCDYVETVLSRYVGRIRTWEIASRVNTGGGLRLDEGDRLKLLAQVLDVARNVDGVDQLSIRIEQPWGGYQSKGEHLLSPLQFVDDLTRRTSSLSAIGLELTLGYEPGDHGQRDMLDVSRLIDLWSTLGLPLHVTLACPGRVEDDPQAAGSSRQVVEIEGVERSWYEDRQSAWIDSLLPLLMAKQGIAGVTWAHLADDDPHEFSQAGLFTREGNPRPVLETIRSRRFAFWPKP